MIQLTADQVADREAARQSTGEFGEHEHSSPEVSLDAPKLTPKQMGLLGFGRSSTNIFADSFDKEEDRPLRPYLPLTPGDDDEFFDAPIGTRVLIATDDLSQRARKFVRHDSDTWHELSELREVVKGEVPSGEPWARPDSRSEPPHVHRAGRASDGAASKRSRDRGDTFGGRVSPG